jgi:Ca2+-binding RTX toxin-like protein
VCNGRMRAFAGGILVVALLLPAGASAATVSVDDLSENKEIDYIAGPGEANRLAASTDGSVVTVRDPGAVIQPGNDCQLVNAHQATCDLVGIAPINAELRGGGDRGRVSGPLIALNGVGGPGHDRFVGGPASDRFDGGFGPDVLLGRGSSDFAFYFTRSEDIRVTLGDGRRNEGGPSDGPKRDRLGGIEAVAGGSGDDHLVGNAAENGLFSAEGRDVLIGKGGGDSFDGGDGRDLSRGGSGGDLFAGSLGRDRALGGKGDDVIQMGSGGENGADLYSGGAGHDTLQGVFFGLIRVTLDGRANDGLCTDPSCASSDEGDNAVGIEEVLGSLGGDVLIGSRRAEVFSPGQGADTVRARGGDDTVHLSIDGVADTINCGAGNDSIVGTPDATDTNANCE